MKDYQQTLLGLVTQTASQDNAKLIVYLEGGYYDSKMGPSEFSINTLTGCIQVSEELIKKQYRVTRVVLGTLVNNIGIVCGENVCEMPAKQMYQNDTDPVLPPVFEEMLADSKIFKKDQIIFTNERRLRNRGLRVIKQLAEEPEKYGLITDQKEEGEVIYSVMIGGKKIPLGIQRGNVWSARCPLIMGQHYSDLYIQFSKKFGNSVTKVLVDMCEMYDRHKVNNGAAVAQLLLEKMYGYDTTNLKIINFCFQDDELDTYEYDVTER